MFRARWEALMSVDDLVAVVEEAGQSERTYSSFFLPSSQHTPINLQTSDHGYWYQLCNVMSGCSQRFIMVAPES